MSVWVIKAGAATYDEPAEYLHDWPGWSTTQGKPEWRPKQMFAHRFDDRNEAIKVAARFPICAYSDDVRIVRLKARVDLDSPEHALCSEALASLRAKLAEAVARAERAERAEQEVARIKATARCERCYCPAADHAVDDEERRGCTICSCDQYKVAL